ncbi:hypothetical protein [Bacillus safensis]|uniref:hypothetical protein n=1 Tax=Bacillus safensis TaxID=561879 RepID=UPI002E2CDECC|nr:hypothetical protein [Bacillus safensis]MED5223229.1 hypothetical protein [Bacillus safensis]
MVKEKTVSFKRTDYDLPLFMMEAVKNIAEHFSIKRNKIYVTDFLQVFKRSKFWKVKNLEEDLKKWKLSFEASHKDRTILSDIIVDSFIQCTSKVEINQLRGALLEAILIGAKGGFKNIDTRDESKRGWGARVFLQKNKNGVIYNCTEHLENSCATRSTVDYGEWNGHHGQFFECKVSPESIGCKEVKYMQFLKSQLKSHEISHEIFFLCAESQFNIELKLEEHKLGPLFKPLGREDISRMLA